MTQFEMGLLLILSLALSVQFGYLWLIQQETGAIVKMMLEKAIHDAGVLEE